MKRQPTPGIGASNAHTHDGFAQIYKYDLYLGLGMVAETSQAFDDFSPIAQTYPFPGSYWFSDFYYPLWRDHGKTRLLVDFFSLLAQYYPAPGKVMAPLTWGHGSGARC